MHTRRKTHSFTHVYSMNELWQLKKFHNNNAIYTVPGTELHI
jgi:hypothetical protein